MCLGLNYPQILTQYVEIWVGLILMFLTMYDTCVFRKRFINPVYVIGLGGNHEHFIDIEGVFDDVCIVYTMHLK